MIRLGLFDPAAQSVLVNARQSTRRTGRESITSREILAACTDDVDVALVFRTVGISPSSVLDRLAGPGDGDHDTGLLLDSIGIDVHEVRSQLAAIGHWSGAGLALRRSRLWPLRVRLGAPSAETLFAGSGRKVLEVAVWNAKRHQRLAIPLDLLRGVLSAADDPARHVVVDTAGKGSNRLFAELHRLDQQAA